MQFLDQTASLKCCERNPKIQQGSESGPSLIALETAVGEYYTCYMHVVCLIAKGNDYSLSEKEKNQ